MNIIDKVFNPTWYAISALPNDRKFEVAYVVVFADGLRTLIQEHVVPDLLNEIRTLYRRNVSSSESRLLAMHASLAIMACSITHRGYSEREFKIINVRAFKGIVEHILTTELASEGEQNIGPYSSDNDNARTQFLLNCARILRIEAIDFAQQLAAGTFGKKWNVNAKVCISGIAEGDRRVSLKPNYREIIFERAKSACKYFSAKGQNVIVALVQSVLKASVSNETVSPSRLGKSERQAEK